MGYPDARLHADFGEQLHIVSQVQVAQYDHADALGLRRQQIEGTVVEEAAGPTDSFRWAAGVGEAGYVAFAVIDGKAARVAARRALIQPATRTLIS